MPELLDLIKALYDDGAPLGNLLGLPVNFKIPRKQLEVSLFHGNPETKEQSDEMEADAHITVEMLLTLKVMKIEPKVENAKNTNIDILSAGENFNEFIKLLREYVDEDAAIIRSLDISRQDFDEIVREYTEIIKGEPEKIDNIMEEWAELPVDAKKGIIRGVLFQRTLMHEILNHLKSRQAAVGKHNQETMKWLMQIAPDLKQIK